CSFSARIFCLFACQKKHRKCGPKNEGGAGDSVPCKKIRAKKSGEGPMEFSFLPWRRKGASLREQKARASAPLAVLTGWPTGAPVRGYEAQVRESYLRNTIAQRAVRLVAESAASAPWVSTPAGHPALRLLEQPNPG